MRETYASATAKREWAAADLIVAWAFHDATTIKAAQSVKDEAVRDWEAASTALEEHVGTHGSKP